MKNKLFLSILLFSLNVLNAENSNNILIDYKAQILEEQCRADTLTLQQFKQTSGTIDTSLSFKGPSINCNGEVEFDTNQFQEMGEKMKKMVKEVLENVQLFAEAEERKTLISGSISMIAYIMTFKPSTATEAQAIATNMGDCIGNITSQSIKGATSAPTGDEGGGQFMGVDIGKIGTLNECIKKSFFPAGMTEKQLAEYTKKKAQIKDLINTILSGNVNLLIEMGELQEKGWCDNSKEEYKDESGLLLSEIGQIVLLDGSLMDSSYILSDSDKSDKELKDIASKNKKFKKSIARQFTVQTNILRDEDFLYVSFMDMMPDAYSLYLQETKMNLEKMKMIYNFNFNETMVLDFMSQFIFDMKMENGSPVPYYYTLYFLNKPLKYYYTIMLHLYAAEQGKKEKKINFDGIPGIVNNFYKKFDLSLLKNPRFVTNFERLELAKRGVTLEFINKYEFIKQEKYDIYHTQLPKLYGHVGNDTFNNFLERDKLKLEKKQADEDTIFYLNMILKKMYDTVGNRIILKPIEGN